MYDSYTLITALFAAVGTLLFGFDTGIATTTIAHRSWIEFMGNPSDGITGAVVALYITGEALGGVVQMMFADQIGRLRFMQIMCVIVTIGSILQTVSVNIGMFLAGRIIAGIAVGGMVGTVPTYLSEISATNSRGFIGGIAGAGISFGAMLANWVGFASGYAPEGELQWRIPLGVQIIWGVLMFGGLATFMPESPRQLIRRGKQDAAMANLAKIRRKQTLLEVQREFDEMSRNIRGEMQLESEMPSFLAAVSASRYRVLVAVAIQAMVTLTGVNVIQYYQTTLFRSLGMSQEMILALTGVYGTCMFISNCVAIRFLIDQWGRRKLLLSGLGSVIFIEIYVTLMQWKFADGSNIVGKGFTLAGIYLFAVAYYGLLNSATWLYSAEILPTTLRSKIMGLACTIHFILNVAVTEAAPTAFAEIKENYYYLFISCSVFFWIFGWFFFKETRNHNLEQIAAVFGETQGPEKRSPETNDDVQQKSVVEAYHLENSERDDCICLD